MRKERKERSVSIIAGSHYRRIMSRPERQEAHLIERALQSNTALLLTAPQEKKGCYVIAPAAGEMSLQSLRLLVNASKPAGARSIFLFLIGPLLLPREPCQRLAGGER